MRIRCMALVCILCLCACTSVNTQRFDLDQVQNNWSQENVHSQKKLLSSYFEEKHGHVSLVTYRSHLNYPLEHYVLENNYVTSDDDDEDITSQDTQHALLRGVQEVLDLLQARDYECNMGHYFSEYLGIQRPLYFTEGFIDYDNKGLQFFMLTHDYDNAIRHNLYLISKSSVVAENLEILRNYVQKF